MGSWVRWYRIQKMGWSRDWVCSCKNPWAAEPLARMSPVARLDRSRADSDVTKQSQSQERTVRGLGLFVQKPLGGGASREDVPNCAIGQKPGRFGFYETKPIPGTDSPGIGFVLANKPLGCRVPLMFKMSTSLGVGRSSPPPSRIPKALPAKVCRGTRGFRVRQTRKQEYSVFKERSATTPSEARPLSKKNKDSIPRLEEYFEAKILGGRASREAVPSCAFA